MTCVLTTALLMAIVAVGGACFQADEHAPIILSRRMNSTVKRNWTIGRGVLLALVALMAVLALHAELIAVLALAVGAWCLWTSAFRLRLNAAMGWDRYYLGSTSQYDLFLISLVLFAKNWRWPNVDGIRATHQGAYRFSGYKADVHRAGKLAYSVELVLFVTSALAACALS